MSLQLYVSQRTKLLLDLESEARLLRGQPPERCAPSRLIESAVERAYGGRLALQAPSAALRPDEERRLRAYRPALGLTPQRLELLIHGLKMEAFRITALGRLAGLAGAQPASVALRSLHDRGLIRLRRLGPWRLSLWRAERGADLERWLQPMPAAGPRLHPAEERRLRDVGRALGLKAPRMELLIHSLKVQSFKPSELARRFRRSGVLATLKRLQDRRLIELERLGRWPTSEWRADKGSALEHALATGGTLRTGRLRAGEEGQLRGNGQTLGLTPQRLDLLILSLKRESFRPFELARSAGLTSQGAQQALRDLHERGLIRLGRLGRGRLSLWRADRGELLGPWLRPAAHRSRPTSRA